MANEIKNAKDGLAALLSTISGLRVLDYPADSISEFPAAVILLSRGTPLRRWVAAPSPAS